MEKETLYQLPKNPEIIPKSSDILKDMRTSLKITKRELALMHGVSVSTVRRWMHGGHLSDAHLEDITGTYFALQTLKRIFIEDKLPEILRRPAQGLKGFSAMDLILDGQIENVADFYADLTSYSDGEIWRMRFHAFGQQNMEDKNFISS